MCCKVPLLVLLAVSTRIDCHKQISLAKSGAGFDFGWPIRIVDHSGLSASML